MSWKLSNNAAHFDMFVHPETGKLAWAFIFKRSVCGDDSFNFYLSRLLSEDVEAFFGSPDGESNTAFRLKGGKRAKDFRYIPQGEWLVIFVPERLRNDSEAWKAVTL